MNSPSGARQRARYTSTKGSQPFHYLIIKTRIDDAHSRLTTVSPRERRNLACESGIEFVRLISDSEGKGRVPPPGPPERAESRGMVLVLYGVDGTKHWGQHSDESNFRVPTRGSAETTGDERDVYSR